MIGFVLAWRLVPSLPTHSHRFDWLGVALSGIGMFLLVFGIQEAHQYDWGTIVGPITVWRLIIGGLVVFAAFVYWQHRNQAEPLVPLRLFRDRNFSLANVGISTVSFAFTAMALPADALRPARARAQPDQGRPAAGPDGGDVDRAGAGGRPADRPVASALDHRGRLRAPSLRALVWLSLLMTPDVSLWMMLFPMALMGAGSACIWAPLTATATRNLPMDLAGAGSGVYNATRQIGAVVGSAAIALLMDARLAANGLVFDPTKATGSDLPPQVHVRFSTAMAEALLLTPAVLLLGLLAAFLFARPSHAQHPQPAVAPASDAAER